MAIKNMGSQKKEDPLTRFVVSLIMLFISGGWMLVTWLATSSMESIIVRQILLTLGAFSTVSFLFSILIFFLDLSDVIEEERAKKAMAYAFAIGILLLCISIILYTGVIATQPTNRYLGNYHD